VLFSPGGWVWIVILVIESGPWLSLDRGLSLVRDRGWLSLVRDRGWLCLDPEGLYIRYPGSVTCGVWRRSVALSEFVGPSCVHGRLLLRCWYSRVTCYPVFYCGHYGDISIFLLFICVTVLVWIGSCFVSVSHVRVK